MTDETENTVVEAEKEEKPARRSRAPKEESSPDLSIEENRHVDTSVRESDEVKPVTHFHGSVSKKNADGVEVLSSYLSDGETWN